MKESEKAVVVAGGVFQKKTFTAALFVGVFQKKTFSGGKTAPGCRRSDCGRMPPHMRDKNDKKNWAERRNSKKTKFSCEYDISQTKSKMINSE